MDDLNAKLNRWTLSRHDFEEAHEYLEIFDTSVNRVIQRALLSAAIIAYGRPFKRGSNNPKADQSISLASDFFTSHEKNLHENIIKIRDGGIAHSDYTRKPTARVPRNDVGLMTWSKSFNPLSEDLNIKQFQDLSWRLHMHCYDEASKINNVLNGTTPSSIQSHDIPPNADINISFPLHKFKSKRE